ncbi:Uncharacterised protein [Providencia rettgeri]|nr:Uncharacterised protein [Providencia rettgeri]
MTPAVKLLEKQKFPSLYILMTTTQMKVTLVMKQYKNLG